MFQNKNNHRKNKKSSMIGAFLISGFEIIYSNTFFFWNTIRRIDHLLSHQ